MQWQSPEELTAWTPKGKKKCLFYPRDVFKPKTHLLKLRIFSAAHVNHPSGSSMKICSLKNPHGKERLRDVVTLPGAAVWGRSNCRVENSVIFDTLPQGKPSELDQRHEMTSGEVQQLPKQFCCRSWCTAASHLLQEWRSMDSSTQRQVLCIWSNSIPFKRNLILPPP